MSLRMGLLGGTLLLCLGWSQQSMALDYESLQTAVKEGSVKIGMRYRYEYVDQDPIDDDAGASTLRGRLTWTSGKVGRWSALAEADYVALIGSERYNSTENGKSNFPVVADPEGFDLNQALFRYTGDNQTYTLGRQRIVQADQRFIGGVAWRQNEQTYDAVRAEFKVGPEIKIDYSYVWNVNRIFGPQDGAQPADWRSNSHFLTASGNIAKGHNLEGYVYLLDFENDNGVPNSSATYGVAYKGGFGKLKLYLAYATQSDYADSPLSYDADFYKAEAKIDLKPVAFTAGMSVLGSDDGAVGFRTPLATLHKFQGFADKFLVTPGTGIEDTYVGLSGALGPVKFAATYHNFESDEGGIDYGDELNAVFTWPITKAMSAQLKFADYSADDFATDTTKVWFTFNVNF